MDFLSLRKEFEAFSDLNPVYGIGIITHNRPHFLSELAHDLRPLFQNNDKKYFLVVVNDGDFLDREKFFPSHETKECVYWLQHESNKGVAHSKNDAFKILLERCPHAQHFFLIEDDMRIKNLDCFFLYAWAGYLSNILHFNYGPGSPFNRKQVIQNFDLHNRHLLSTTSELQPRLYAQYEHTILPIRLAFYTHIVGMFSYFHRRVLEDVGFFDAENFPSAFDHVEHTYRIIKKGYHPPFWWFADLAQSDKLISEQPTAIAQSQIAKDQNRWMQAVYEARERFRMKHGHYPNIHPHNATQEEVVFDLKKRKKMKDDQLTNCSTID